MSSPYDVIAKQKNFTMLPYVKKEGHNASDGDQPLGFTISEFHVLFLY